MFTKVNTIIEMLKDKEIKVDSDFRDILQQKSEKELKEKAGVYINQFWVDEESVCFAVSIWTRGGFRFLTYYRRMLP